MFYMSSKHQHLEKYENSFSNWSIRWDLFAQASKKFLLSLDWQNSKESKHLFPNFETLRFLDHPQSKHRRNRNRTEQLRFGFLGGRSRRRFLDHSQPQEIVRFRYCRFSDFRYFRHFRFFVFLDEPKPHEGRIRVDDFRESDLSGPPQNADSDFA